MALLIYVQAIIRGSHPPESAGDLAIPGLIAIVALLVMFACGWRHPSVGPMVFAGWMVATLGGALALLSMLAFDETVFRTAEVLLPLSIFLLAIGAGRWLISRAQPAADPAS